MSYYFYFTLRHQYISRGLMLITLGLRVRILSGLWVFMFFRRNNHSF